MLVPIDSLNPGDKFIELSSEPRLDVHFTVERKIGDKIVAIDEFDYTFRALNWYELTRFNISLYNLICFSVRFSINLFIEKSRGGEKNRKYEQISNLII